jgi:hypothetical protein
MFSRERVTDAYQSMLAEGLQYEPWSLFKNTR